MSRKGSVSTVPPKRPTQGGKRVSLKDGTLVVPSWSRHSLGDIREGDVYYKTVNIYPSLPDNQEEIIVTIVKPGKDPRAGSSAGNHAVESRRGSFLGRDETSSPAVGRNESPSRDRAASIAASAGGPDSKRPKALIWPEWSEKEVNEEKWDVLHKGKGGKEDKGKSPVATVHFDDPEGKIDLPSSLRVDQQNWKRPSEFILDKTPVVVAEPEGLTAFDLVSANEHLHHSELMRYIISQIVALWEMSVEKNDNSDQCDISQPYEENLHTWRPWEHIYALSKVQKPPFVTVYNPYGKYVVRLYWMGCWRKIIVDDLMPFDENDNLLLPATTLQHELWPMLLTKALIKVASLDYTGGSQSSEFGDCSIIHSLTGWIPEAIPLQGFLTSDSAPTPGVNSLPSAGCGRASPLLTARQVLDKYFHLSAHPSSDIAAMPHGTAHRIKYGHISEVWELLKGSLPEWKLPLQEWEKQQLEQQELDKKDDGTQSEIAKENASEKDAVSKGDKAEKADSKSGKDGGKDKGGKDAKDKDKGKDKDKKDKDKDKGQKDKEKSTLEDSPIPDNPEVVVFGTYWSTPKYPVKVSVLGEMADASEKLRQNGLSHIYPHPVCITQTRSCPLEPPPPPEKIPAWKLIRPRKKKATPSDEPQSEPQPPKPIQCIEITSPFVNYKVSPVPIPTETHRPKSSLERGGTRSRPDTATHPIEESDENAPEPDPNQKKEDEELGIKEDIPKPEDTAQNELETSSKPSSPVGKEKRSKLISKPKDGKEAKDSRESPKQKRGSSAKGEKPKSAERVDSGSKKSKDEKKGTPPAPTNLSSDSGLAPPPPADPNAPGAEGEGQEGEEHKDDGQVYRGHFQS
ncbi:hypothetical protein FSP39_014000 [Pinctada imbricata]|uniref:Calpain catalytic domain-containing protein n=1 Tax=Pinctada imbricata TaxID=66713 RepID=A0AA88Y4S1_PINIB|nr:hypothetical protein FSP39_014000 [Pinctada imbricata]